MVTATSFYWFDYETFGTSPAWDRPSQFAGLRTDMDLQPVGEACVFYCRLPGDYLPDPRACRITGITPDEVQKLGSNEAQFIAKVRQQLGHEGTCSVGYNSIRFDDEFTRHTLFRNLLDPYEYEWKDGNSRWDMLDIVRLTRALRPGDIHWPLHADGRPSNRLEHLTAANDIEHSHAHDALSDVEATVAVARLIRAHQPRLFDYAFAHRGKQSVAELVNVRARKPLILISGTIPASRSHLAIVMPVARHPVNQNGVIVLDLQHDPSELADLDADAIAAKVFTPAAKTTDIKRLGLRTIQINKCPVLVPLSTLRPEDADRLGIDMAAQLNHATRLTDILDDALVERLRHAMTRQWDEGPVDVDGSLYSGNFLSQADRQRLARLHAASPSELSKFNGLFDDSRLDEMLQRYRARNYPESLSKQEKLIWQQDLRYRLTDDDQPWLTLSRFNTVMKETDWRSEEYALRDSLRRYVDSLQLTGTAS
ncbi:MAG: exodeoxyribonuclease I [Granulosicoccus sp.]